MRLLPIIALALSIAALPVAASPSMQMFNCGYRVVAVGDSAGKLEQSCGSANRTVQLETRKGGAAGVRYEYDRGSSTLLFTVTGGRIARIERAPR
jgi:hypothetical protein